MKQYVCDICDKTNIFKFEYTVKIHKRFLNNDDRFKYHICNSCAERIEEAVSKVIEEINGNG